MLAEKSRFMNLLEDAWVKEFVPPMPPIFTGQGGCESSHSTNTIPTKCVT